MSNTLHPTPPPRRRPDTYRQGLEGARRAAEHADLIHSSLYWTDNAIILLRRYAMTHDSFLSEEVRHWAHTEQGFASPPDPRAWGHVMIRAAAAGIIERTGEYRMTKLPPAHAGPRVVWRSLVR